MSTEKPAGTSSDLGEAEGKRRAIMTSPLRWPIAIAIIFLFGINILIWIYYMAPSRFIVDHQFCETVTTATRTPSREDVTEPSLPIATETKTCNEPEPNIIIPIAAGILALTIVASMVIVLDAKVKTPYFELDTRRNPTETQELANKSLETTSYSERALEASDDFTDPVS